MTQFIPMRTTDPPSTALRPAAGGRLCHSQKSRLAAHGALAQDGDDGPSSGANVVLMAELAWLLEYFAATRAVKSP